MNLTRVIFGADYCPVLIAKDFTEVKHFFKNLKKNHSDNDELSWSEITNIYLFIYDDRYEVDMDMSGDLYVLDKDTDELVEQEHWSDRVP